MESKLILENLQRYTKELEEQYPNETAYWHLQKLRNEIERVKNIAYEPMLAVVDSADNIAEKLKNKYGYKTMGTNETDPKDWRIKENVKVGDIIDFINNR